MYRNLSVCKDTNRHSPENIFIIPGKGINIDLNDVKEGHVSILLARLELDSRLKKAFDFRSRRPLVKIDFSTIIEVEDEKKVELVIELKRKCHGESVTLEQYKLEFDDVELLPFSFTFIDDAIHDFKKHCLYTVKIKRINVKDGKRVDEIETKNTAINAIVQKKDFLSVKC